MRGGVQCCSTQVSLSNAHRSVASCTSQITTVQHTSNMRYPSTDRNKTGQLDNKRDIIFDVSVPLTSETVENQDLFCVFTILNRQLNTIACHLLEVLTKCLFIYFKICTSYVDNIVFIMILTQAAEVK